jgi:hypothetical protein
VTTSQLITALNIDPTRLGQWITEGLPHRKIGRGRQFDECAVTEWLIARGHVKGPRYVATIAEAATALGRHERTVKGWLAAGAPGQTADGYDVDALAAWQAERRQTDPLLAGQVSPMLERYRGERYRLARLERKERERELIPRQLVADWISNFCAITRQTLTALRTLAGDQAMELVAEGLQEAETSFCREWGQFLKTNSLTTVLTQMEEDGRQHDIDQAAEPAEHFPGNPQGVSRTEAAPAGAGAR